MRPSPLAVHELRSRVLQGGGYDLVHAYKPYSCTESFYATMRHRTRMLGTIYSMAIPGYLLPSAFPVIGGTAVLREDLSSRRDPDAVYRLDPPVDVEANAPNVESGRRFRERHSIDERETVVALVSRLDVQLKLDGLVDAVTAAECLAARTAIRLVVVGDGPARQLIVRRAAEVNGSSREVVSVLGHMPNPRAVYCAADVVIGMGTSLLRGMATAKPCVLVGERSLVTVVRPETVGPYLRQGFWGIGDGKDGAARLARALEEVFALPPSARQELGDFGRDLVIGKFGLDRAVGDLEAIYGAVPSWSAPPWQLYAEAVRSAGRVVAFKAYHRRPSRRRAERRALANGTGT